MKKQNILLRLTQSIYSTPQLITAEAFAPIDQYLQDRNSGVLLYRDGKAEDTPPAKPELFYNKKQKIGVLNIDGTLTNKPVVTLCGEVGTAYSTLVEQASEMLDAGVTTIIMSVDSGGGEAFNCFQSASTVREMADKAGAKIYGYNGGMAASAAYAWLSICDEVFAHPDADTGSIGVLVSLLDTSKAMEQQGYKRVFVTAGEQKIPYAEDGSFKKEFLQDLQYKVDALYENFVSHVSKYIGLSAEAIKATKAKTFMSKDSLELGLIDGIKTEEEFQAYVISKHKGD
jgi:ClpP class serine protease